MVRPIHSEKIVRKALHCPACGGELQITRLNCGSCEIEINRFAATVFDRLSPGSLAFAEAFLRARGNVKEMERELGVPYAAVRNRLDEVIAELGFERRGEAPAAPPEEGGRRRVLERLEGGEIDAETAVAMLEQLKEDGT